MLMMKRQEKLLDYWFMRIKQATDVAAAAQKQQQQGQLSTGRIEVQAAALATAAEVVGCRGCCG
jgi:hypothetical protein